MPQEHNLKLFDGDDKVKVCFVCHTRFPSQRSCAQSLERRKLYYIELLHSNYISSDHAQIHVVYPGSARHQPIERRHLMQYSSGSIMIQTIGFSTVFTCGWVTLSIYSMSWPGIPAMALYALIWCGMVWYGMVWYGMAWYGTVWYGMIVVGMAWNGMVDVVR